MSNKIPNDLKYTKSHEWVRQRRTARSKSASPIMRKRARAIWCSSRSREVGRNLKAGEACAVVESVKAASDVYSPVAGKVIADNDGCPPSPNCSTRIPMARVGCFASNRSKAPATPRSHERRATTQSSWRRTPK